MFIKTLILEKINYKYIIKFVVLLSVANIAPLIGIHSQWVTGPIVNMALILAVFMLGARGALLIGMLPSTIALGIGLLPAILAPMVPFIIVSNVILVLMIDRLTTDNKLQTTNDKRLTTNYWLVLLLGAGLKYLFLWATSGVVISLLLNKTVAAKLAMMMSWPQFVTAVIGGVMAYCVLKLSVKNR